MLSRGNLGNGVTVQAALHKVAGRPNTYRGAALIPSGGQGNATWIIDTVWLTDLAGQTRGVTNKYLVHKGFEHQFKVVSTTDTSAPIITDFSRTPAVLDLRVNRREAQSHAPPEGQGSRRRVPCGLRRVAKHDRRPALPDAQIRDCLRRNMVGKRASCVASRKPVSGTPLSRYTTLRRNARIYGTQTLSNHGWPATVTVRATDHARPTATGPDDIDPTANATFRFNESVNGINDERRRSCMPTPTDSRRRDSRAPGPARPKPTRKPTARRARCDRRPSIRQRTLPLARTTPSNSTRSTSYP